MSPISLGRRFQRNAFPRLRGRSYRTCAKDGPRIRGSSSQEDRLWLADANATLFLSVLQSIPYEPQRDVFDWDHIFPKNKASLMWSPGPEGRWRRHHSHRHLVGSAGNFWGLNASANRAAQYRLPDSKFHLIENKSEVNGWRIWPRERWWITDEEIRAFSEIGCALQAGHDIDSAMERFRVVVTARALRMTDEMFSQWPDAEWFAADKGGSGTDAKPEPQIAHAMGIQFLEEDQAAPTPRPPSGPDERVERVQGCWAHNPPARSTLPNRVPERGRPFSPRIIRALKGRALARAVDECGPASRR